MEQPISAPQIFLYFYWVILVLIFILILGFFLYRMNKHVEFFQNGKKWQRNIFPVTLIVLGFLLYLIELTPSFSGYFDVKTMEFIKGFEENSIISFMRFFYKAVIGILLLSYGLMGRHEEVKSDK